MTACEMGAAISLLALIALTVLAFILFRQIGRLQADLARQGESLGALASAMKVISGEAFHVRQDQATVGQALERLADQQNEMRLEMRLRDADRTPYAQAIQLIRNGQTRDEVRKLCALTQSEVDLLFSLHGQGISRRFDAPDAAAGH